MQTFWALLVIFVAVSLLGRYYVNGVHALGRFIVRRAPTRLALILSKHLYTNEHDLARGYDSIAAVRNRIRRGMQLGEPIKASTLAGAQNKLPKH